MPSFGTRSRKCLDTCDYRLVNICEIVIQDHDFAVIWGFRSEEQQNILYPVYTTKLWPDSMHNHRFALIEGGFTPESHAIDIAPWHSVKPHIRWDNEREFVFLAGCMIQAARSTGVTLRWGGDWDMDMDLYDSNKPFDLGHFELR
jgi:hypothetical protein